MAVFGKIIMNEIYQAVSTPSLSSVTAGRSSSAKTPTVGQYGNLYEAIPIFEDLKSTSSSPTTTDNLISDTAVSSNPPLSPATAGQSTLPSSQIIAPDTRVRDISQATTILVSMVSASNTTIDGQVSSLGVTHVASTDSKPLTEFPLFPGLPIELRLKVWNDALPPSTNLQVVAYVHKGKLDGVLCIPTGTYGNFEPKDVRSVTLLRVSHEANEVYTNAFPHCIPVEKFDTKRGFERIGHVRIGSHDTLYIKYLPEASRPTLVRYQPQPTGIDIKLVQLYLDPTLSVHHFKWLLKTFRSLQTFQVITTIGHFTESHGIVQLILTRMKKNILFATQELLLSDPVPYAPLTIPDLIGGGYSAIG
ncbi:hypothetical protein BDZ45DRAFT_780179 [Acephala macrosclerotiorum]|nr:hypothetical protein BDZ45DRAFT_780179 [Acephala macrosclerotiorum]